MYKTKKIRVYQIESKIPLYSIQNILIPDFNPRFADIQKQL